MAVPWLSGHVTVGYHLRGALRAFVELFNELVDDIAVLHEGGHRNVTRSSDVTSHIVIISDVNNDK